MGTIYHGATLTPHFTDFLPAWVARQPWYSGAGVPALAPVGYYRFEDPAGEVGMETHLVTDGAALYQVPMTYRGAPLGSADGLITTAEHSVLGTRWIYDGVADPAWVGELLRLVDTEGVSEPSTKKGVGPAQARGRRLGNVRGATVELTRAVTEGEPPDGPGLAGVVVGTWHPTGAEGAAATGCLAVLRAAPAQSAGGTSV